MVRDGGGLGLPDRVLRNPLEEDGMQRVKFI
jgi:hypothetical protein